MKNKKEFAVQVEKEHYYENYDKLERFISYYHQIKATIETKPKKVLEIGIGNKTVTNYLKEFGYEVRTCDFDKSLSPDEVADIRQLPYKNDSFDTTIACEILEHIPFTDLPQALEELRRVSKNYVIVSFPHSSFGIEIGFKLFLQFFNKRLFLPIRIPYFFLPSSLKRNHQHYWEMGRFDHPSWKVKKEFKKYFEIEKTFHPLFNQNHYFMVLKPLDK